MKFKLIKYSITYIFVVVLIIVCNKTFSQDSDELFKQARAAAFDNKNYPVAISISKQALQKSPDYKDIRVFLGRVYTWSDKLDSARNEFETVLRQEPAHEDASLAYANLENWNDGPQKALELINTSLQQHPESKELLLLKAKILSAQENYREANAVILKLLSSDPKNANVRAMAERIQDRSSINKVGLSYDFIHFDKQFTDPWHLASFDYGRQTKFGSLTGRINYANRFKSNGLQFEVDAYPRISSTFYTYVSGGYSADVGVFPNYRAGFSLYANLPKSFEADAGFRYLRFSDNTWIYTFALGKYISNYWLNFRSYLTPSTASISQSYALTLRYYFGGTDDYFKISAGTGLSPDETSNNVLLNNTYKLKSNNVSLGYSHSFNSLNVISINTSWQNQEYRIKTFGNQINGGLSYKRRF